MVQLLVLLLVVVLVIFPIWALIKIISLNGSMESLQSEVHALRRQLQEFRSRLAKLTATRPAAEEPPGAVVTPARSSTPAAQTAPEPFARPAAPAPPPPIPAVPIPPAPLAPAEPAQPALPTFTPEPPVSPEPPIASTPSSVPLPAAAFESVSSPPPPAQRPIYEPPAPEPSAVQTFLENIDWEQFTGAKLLAWIGGFLAFLGLAFFVKYSFEHGWISPELRAAGGFLFALPLVVGGLRINRERYATTAQTLIATGIVSLYAVTFACSAVYKFAVFREHALLPFSLMVLVTLTAFLLAVRLEARVIAILGILGGFLTPVLLATGEDNPAGLFGYIALLDLGLIAVALHRRWHFLIPLGAVGTIGMEIGWAAKFFGTDPSAKSAVAIIVSVAFSALFLAACVWARRRDRSSTELLWSAVALPCVCFGFGLYFLGFPVVAAQLGLFFTFVLLADLCLLALAWVEGQARLVALAAAGTLLLQVSWAAKMITAAHMPALLAIALGFAVGFLLTHLAARRSQRTAPEILWSAAALPLLGFVFALSALQYDEVAARLWLLFGFVAAFDACLLVLAWVERNSVFVALGAVGTAAVEAFWMFSHLRPDRAVGIMAVVLGFGAAYFAIHLAARRTHRAGAGSLWSAVGLCFLPLLFGLTFIADPVLAARPGLVFTFLLLADGLLLALTWLDEYVPKLHLVAGLTVFLLLAAWTTERLTASLLPWALAFYLLHAALHTAFPLVLERHRAATSPTWWSQLFPPLALLLLMLPLIKLEAVSILYWPSVLLIDLLAIGLAVFTASLVAVAVVLVLTLSATAVWMFHVPATLASSTSLLLVIGGFALLFFAVGLYLSRRFAAQLSTASGTLPGILGDGRASIPAFSALLPFLLLIMMTQRLPLANPGPVFGLALLLVILVLGLTRLLAIEWLPACALLGTGALEYAWQVRLFSPAHGGPVLAWYIGFYAVLAVYPFLFRRKFRELTGPWAVAAFAAVVQFPLVYHVIRTTWPNDFLGLVPAIFALPPLASVILVLRMKHGETRPRLNQLACFGGVALLFITLIFPIQFSRQWLTLGWALEGAALLWLYHRVPHEGLRLTGVGLLLAAFARLALNPAVLEYHARSNVPLLNWYLYSFGIVTVSLFAGARLLAPPRERVLGSNGPALLNTLGTILAFLLVNIEIADFFSLPGARVLTFQFTGNFGRDMTYTIAWAAFALALLLISIRRQVRAGRYAALALLGVALLKLFFHDLARLEALYRIGALFAVAVVAIVASVAYQRFLPANAKPSADNP